MIPAELQRRDLLQKVVSNLRYELERTKKKKRRAKKERKQGLPVPETPFRNQGIYQSTLKRLEMR